MTKSQNKLENPPFPGSIGKEIFNNVSKEKWNEWLEMQMKLINENRLDLASPDHKRLLMKEMVKFLSLDPTFLEL